MMSDVALPLQQHPHFGAALTRLGRDVHLLDLGGVAPVLAVKQMGQLMASRGPRAQVDAAALRQSRLRLMNAETADDANYRVAGFRRLMTNAHVAELDLTTTAEARQRAMKPKWRNAWRAAQHTAFAVRTARYDASRCAWLLQADRAQQRAKRFRSLPHALIDAYAAAQPDAVHTVVAQEGNTPIAGMLFLLHPPAVTYHIGWTNMRGRTVCAHHRMLVEAADHFAKIGFTRLDLGQVETDNAPGLARFKIGTGANIRPLGGTWLRLPGC